LLFHEYSFQVVEVPSSLIAHGPSSKYKPVKEEHPGPPLSQRTMGSVFGSFLDSKNQKKKCFFFSASRYPEYY
jgi:hypothetical protein